MGNRHIGMLLLQTQSILHFQVCSPYLHISAKCYFTVLKNCILFHDKVEMKKSEFVFIYMKAYISEGVVLSNVFSGNSLNLQQKIIQV